MIQTARLTRHRLSYQPCTQLAFLRSSTQMAAPRSIYTDLPKLVVSPNKASSPSYTRWLSFTFHGVESIQPANGCTFQWYWNISVICVLILQTVSKCERIPRFFWELSHMRKQSIPARFSPPTRPGYEARHHHTNCMGLVSWAHSKCLCVIANCVLQENCLFLWWPIPSQFSTQEPIILLGC